MMLVMGLAIAQETDVEHWGQQEVGYDLILFPQNLIQMASD